MWASFVKHWFLASIAVCFTVGYVFADVLAPISKIAGLRDGIVFLVMWAMGVTLRADTIRASIGKPVPSLLAIGINLFVVPLLTLPTMWFLPEKIFGGLFVASLVPCTLASASVWTRRAGGDDSIAMMTTVVTNLACVAVVPIGLVMVMSRQSEISAADQIAKLALLVVAPLLLAQTMRWFGIANWADRNKSHLGLVGQLGILAMVLFGAIASSVTLRAGGDNDAVRWIAIAMLVLSAASIHTVALWIGVVSARLLGQPAPRQIAVGISGSQKTLMVGLQIAIDCGVSVVPMLVYHIGQLIIDTVIADRWKRGSATPRADENE